MQELLRLRDEGRLTPAQAQWFRPSKEADELFDTIADPNELNNLAENPEHREVLDNLKIEMDRWLDQIGDNPKLSESDLVEKLWNGKASKSKTADPEMSIEGGVASLTSSTPGASISYKIIQNNYEPVPWTIYSEPFIFPDGATLKIQAHRIGYGESKVMLHRYP
jgi:hypothetical protein